LLKFPADRFEGTNCGQAFLGVAAVQLQVFADKGLQELMGIAAEYTKLNQNFPQRPGFVPLPLLQATAEGIGGKEAQLHRQQAKEEVAIGSRP
jgi:hypothetical protein